KNLVLQTGHIERFNPAFVALRRRIERPRFFEAHRMGVFTPRSLDIDVVMDLMVHELDIIASLVRSDVVKLEAVGVPILTPRSIPPPPARIPPTGAPPTSPPAASPARGCASSASFNLTNITRSITPNSRWRRSNCSRRRPPGPCPKSRLKAC